MRVDRKKIGVVLLFLMVGAAVGCSPVEVNVPLETQPLANEKDPVPGPTFRAEQDSPTPFRSPTSLPSTPVGQPGAGGPALSVSPSQAEIGSHVTVTVRGFPEQVPVDIGIGRVNAGYDVVAEGMTGPAGIMEVRVSIPAFVNPEDEWVMVAAADKGRVKVVSGRLNISKNGRQASVEVSPRRVAVGSTVDVLARGFTPGADMEIGIGRVNSEFDVISQGETGPDGTLSTEVTIPDFVDPADEWVVVVQEQGSPAKAVSGKLEVGSRRSQASLVVLSASVSVGDAIDVRGSGFPSDTQVALGIGRVNSEYDLTDSVKTDKDGQFRTQYTIPDFVDVEDGWILVAVTDDDRVKVITEPVKISD